MKKDLENRNILLIFASSIKNIMSKITFTQNKGFQVTFENNITLSVQGGKGNYCSNRHNENNPLTQTSTDVEIAIWDAEGNAHKFDSEGETKGWVSMEELVDWFDKCRNTKSLKDLK